MLTWPWRRSKDQFSTSAYRLMLAWKGMVFRRERLARAGEQTPELAALFRQLQQVAGQLAKLAWATPDPQAGGPLAGKHRHAFRKEGTVGGGTLLTKRRLPAGQAHRPPWRMSRPRCPKTWCSSTSWSSGTAEWVAVPQRGGLGVRFEQTDAGTKITVVLAGGAAAQDGRLQPGDLIVEITDHAGKWTATAGKSLQGVRDLIGGDAGSKVSLRVRRAQEQEPREITLTRAPLPWQKKFEWKGELENVAFVVRHDGPVVRLNLGPARPVSEAIDTWRETCGMSPQSAAAGRLLREKIWEPIAAQIQGAKIVLALAGWGPEQAAAGGPAGQGSGQIPDRRVPAGHRAHGADDPGNRPRRNTQAAAGKPAAGGQYRLRRPVRPASRMRRAARARRAGIRRKASSTSTACRPPQREVALIEKLYHQDFGPAGIETLEEDQATKAAFLAEAGRYRYLHLATHGFFIQENAAHGRNPVARGAALLGGPQSAELHAGLLSGLALAGANQAGRRRAGGSAADNGILTAEEIGTQNLDGVQLVMLSACETGLGKEAGGEGLLGPATVVPGRRRTVGRGQPLESARRRDEGPDGRLLYESLAAEAVAPGVAAAGAVGHAAELRRPGRPLAGARLFADRCPARGRRGGETGRGPTDEIIAGLLGRLRAQRRLAVRDRRTGFPHSRRSKRPCPTMRS